VGQLCGSSSTGHSGRWCTVVAVRDLSGVDYVYLGADGIHVNIPLEEHKLCLLVMIGVRSAGREGLVALTNGLPRVHRGVGRICCATPPAAGCAPRSSRSVIGALRRGRR
jgi:hypothetical protein